MQGARVDVPLVEHQTNDEPERTQANTNAIVW